jgi:hypothetical protein
MAKHASKSEKAHRVDAVRRLKSSGATRSDILQFATKEWGLSVRQIDNYIAAANQQIIEDFSIDRAQYTADLLSVLHRVIKEGQKSNQLGAVCNAIAQAAKLARLDVS